MSLMRARSLSTYEYISDQTSLVSNLYRPKALKFLYCVRAVNISLKMIMFCDKVILSLSFRNQLWVIMSFSRKIIDERDAQTSCIWLRDFCQSREIFMWSSSECQQNIWFYNLFIFRLLLFPAHHMWPGSAIWSLHFRAGSADVCRSRVTRNHNLLFNIWGVT